MQPSSDEKVVKTASLFQSILNHLYCLDVLGLNPAAIQVNENPHTHSLR